MATNSPPSKTIPLTDLLGQYRIIKKEIDNTIQKTLLSGQYILAKNVQEFETKLAKFVGVKYAVTVASGTDALMIALKSLDLTPRDEVILPANVYPTSFGVSLAGVKIKLVDVDPNTLNVSLATIKKAVTPKTKAIIVVHLYGNPVDIVAIKNFAKKNGLYLIEDCAQAIGARYLGKCVGSFGDIGCFSFYPTKNLGAYGDGGAVLTNSRKLSEKVKLLRMYGEKKRYQSEIIGFNSRLDELQAGILLTKLGHLKNWNNRRREIAKKYQIGLRNLPLTITSVPSDSKSTYHLFTVRTIKRNQLARYLQEQGIFTGIHYPVPIHLVPAFVNLGYKAGDFPVSEEASKTLLSLPIYPHMKNKDVDVIIETIRQFFANQKS